MKALVPALGVASLVILAAIGPSWAGDTVRAVEAPKAQVEGRDTVTFVSGAEAEPPAMPEGTPMPEPRKTSGAKPVAAKKEHQPVTAAAKEAKFATPESVKKKHPAIHPVSAKVANPEHKPTPAHDAVRWDD